MKKSLLFAALAFVLQYNFVQAQTLFDAPDTVCIDQPVQLVSNADASSHYWGFCSGYLANAPQGGNMGSSFGFNNPTAIEIAKDGENYYGFVANTGSNEFMKLSFGTSLLNTPTVTNYGNMNGALPPSISSIYVVKDEAQDKWFLFIAGGTDVATSALARIDFDNSLANTPNIVNFGNPGNLLNFPAGVFVAGEAGSWYGYVLNKADNKLLHINIGNNISLTPTLTDFGNPGGVLDVPSDLVPIMDGGNWYFFVTNQGISNSVARIDAGPSINGAVVPNGVFIGDLNGTLFGPSGLNIIRDCGSVYAFITNQTTNDMVRMNMASVTGPYTGTPYTVPALGLAVPTGISRIIRNRDNLAAFVINSGDNSLSRVLYQQCNSTTIPFSTSSVPPEYEYTVPGTYNVYYAINEGDPSMQIECKQIVALPKPQINRSNDTTICQGDTITLVVQSPKALRYSWAPAYNMSDTQGITLRVWPEYTFSYGVTIPYANGCIVDTNIDITVRKIKADAGPDRTLADGASTTLGGPLTTTGPQYTYTWIPNQFINNNIIPEPVANPGFDFTYVLQVQDDQGCLDRDTVTIDVICNGINLPNAFAPASTGEASRFGLLNRRIVQLNYFKIFDRWGKEVFSTTDAMKEWDGTINGEPAPLGVYVWEADGFCVEGQRFKQSGNVTLIR